MIQLINLVSGKCSVILSYLKRWTFVEIIASFCEPRSSDNFFSPSNILLFNLINLILFFTLLWTSRYLPPGEGREEEWWRLVFCHLLWERNSLARSSLVRLILHNSWKKKIVHAKVVVIQCVVQDDNTWALLILVLSTLFSLFKSSL